jgi:hypothetical protein
MAEEAKENVVGESDISISMAEGEMSIGRYKTKGFRLYSILLISLIGFLVACALGSPQVGAI